MDNIPNTTTISVRVDGMTKKEADMLFKDLGLNMSTAINMFLTKCVKTASIPFEIAEPKPSRRLKRALKEAEDMEKHPEKYKSYNNVQEMIDDILNED